MWSPDIEDPEKFSEVLTWEYGECNLFESHWSFIKNDILFTLQLES